MDDAECPAAIFIWFRRDHRTIGEIDNRDRRTRPVDKPFALGMTEAATFDRSWPIKMRKGLDCRYTKQSRPMFTSIAGVKTEIPAQNAGGAWFSRDGGLLLTASGVLVFGTELTLCVCVRLGVDGSLNLVAKRKFEIHAALSFVQVKE